MFNYKTQAELDKMTPEELEKYAIDKRTFETESTAKMIQEAMAKQAEAIKAEVSKDAFSKDSAEFKAMEATIENLNKSIEDLGKRNTPEIVGVTKKVGAIFQEKHQEMEKNGVNHPRGDKNEKFAIETKAFDSLNVHSVNTVASGVYPEDGTVSAVGSTYRTVYAQILGLYNVPRVYSKIMDVVDIQPLVSDTIIAFTQTITSGFAITPECVEKPVSKIALTSESTTANPVASLFYTTLHIRRFYPALVNQFVQTFNKLLQEAIPNYVMAQVRANATAFTPVADLTWDDPEHFEAIVAVVTSLKMLGYMPNMVALSPIAYAKMVTATNGEGTYKLQNGSSIILVGDTIKIGSYNLRVIEDAYLEADEFMVGDAFEAVKVGLDSTVLYFETDGRTDNQNAAGESPSTGLSVNIRTHELAQFVGVLLPAGAKGALIRDTFANVITLITAEAPSV